MAIPEIEEFGQLLIEKVRDAAIRSSDRALKEEHVVAKRWQAAAGGRSLESFAMVLIPDIIDDTLFYLLHAIDDGSLRIAFTASNGKTIDLSTEGLGELAGWYVGRDAWRSMYSKERFVED